MRRLHRYLYALSAPILLVLLLATTSASGLHVRQANGNLDPAPTLTLGLVPFADELQQPTTIQHAGDERLFVLEKAGRVRVIESDGSVLPTPFLDIAEQVESDGHEQGLLGLAFHPDYASNGFFYLNYTDTQGDTVVSRFSRSATDPDQADASSEAVLLTVQQPYTNHNGGNILFGPDGYLYIGMGDGGAGNDPDNNAQDESTLLGKMLRIDVDRRQGSLSYAIPADNPFFDNPGAAPCGETEANRCSEIWALGLRNPWRFSFDRETGDLYIGDVGQNDWEEIDFQAASSRGGENYGWRCYEGNNRNPNIPPCEVPDHVPPIHDYSHDMGRTITGGFVYRGTTYPEMRGHYLFGDYVDGNLWALKEVDGTWQITGRMENALNNPSTFGEDINGELYVADISSGRIYRIAVNSHRLYLPLTQAGSPD
ncbi:MAG: PQQ-dependent sugar dehydrogenase [Chloroflexota bacterium]|nr:PQQ-dependent sugar dehydrogenase [Chloroflexota bacterium]